jgi:Ca2+-binding RTX toxin-like protein
LGGLTSSGAGGVYTLSGTAAAITNELDALVFTPIFTQKAGAPITSSTTTFTLSDLSSAGGAPAVDMTATVIDKTASTIIETRCGNDLLVGGAAGVVLFGGSGTDHFIFEMCMASPPRHPDTIMDFDHRQGDKIDFHDLRDFVLGSEPLAFIDSQTFAQFHHNHHGVFGMVRYARLGARCR